MREIEFKGKASHSGEWVFGSLLKICGNFHIVSETDMYEDGHHIRQESDMPTWVDPETCQIIFSQKESHNIISYINY